MLPTWPFLAAQCKGGRPVLSGASGSAFAARRRVTISVWPFLAAQYRAVSPLASLAPGSAFAARRRVTISVRPSFAAQYRGVSPLVSVASGSAPASRRRRTMSARPPFAAQYNGVSPFLSVAFGAALASRSAVTSATWPSRNRPVERSTPVPVRHVRIGRRLRAGRWRRRHDPRASPDAAMRIRPCPPRLGSAPARRRRRTAPASPRSAASCSRGSRTEASLPMSGSAVSLEQGVDDVRVALAGGPVQRRASVLPGRIRIGAGFEQGDGGIGMALARRPGKG